MTPQATSPTAPARRARTTWLLVFASASLACAQSSQTQQATPPQAPEAPPSDRSRAASGPVCTLIGPRTDSLGVYGTDLGFTVPSGTAGDAPIWIMFGDTWGEVGEGCLYLQEEYDDLMGTLPAALPEHLALGKPSPTESCKALQYRLATRKNLQSWPRARLYEPPPEGDRPGHALTLGLLRTPVGVFRDADRVYALFHRNTPVFCDRESPCPKGMACTSDLADIRLGRCATGEAAPAGGARIFCTTDEQCSGTACEPIKDDVCLNLAPFEAQTPKGGVVPSWYQEDPRKGVARTMFIGELMEESTGDFRVVARFESQRFSNVAARTVAHFDAENPDDNDYRAGHHTLLLWGRPAFVGKDGAQSLPFLLYQPLPEAGEGPLTWSPRFFAGYDDRGRPRWSPTEADAQPIYGAQADLDSEGQLRWKFPEFDYVDQMSLSWVAALDRWVMFYGGDVPQFLAADDDGESTGPVHPQPAPGAIHMRAARHPWGAETRGSAGGWSAPEPVLTRRQAAPIMTCSNRPEIRRDMPGCLSEGDPDSLWDLLGTLADQTTELTPGAFFSVAGKCVEGEVAQQIQKDMSGDDPIGRLYAPNIIDPWTRVVRDTTGGGEIVELFWNVSTWNPYQVALIKTRLAMPPGQPPAAGRPLPRSAR